MRFLENDATFNCACSSVESDNPKLLNPKTKREHPRYAWNRDDKALSMCASDMTAGAAFDHENNLKNRSGPRCAMSKVDKKKTELVRAKPNDKTLRPKRPTPCDVMIAPE